MCSPDSLIPGVGVIQKIIDETADTKTFYVLNKKGKKSFPHMPGQCAMIGIPGVGEAMFSISSAKSTDAMEFTIKSVGKLTNYLHKLEAGNEITLRGAYGNPFPVDDELKGKNLLFIAGGIGIAPLRSVIRYVFANRANYGSIDIVYGARSASDLLYKHEFDTWKEQSNTRVYLTIDRAEKDWNGNVGFVPTYLKDIGFAPNRTAIICGPPVMIKYSLAELEGMEFDKTQVYTTLEMRMKCGIGKCGRCNIGSKYACKDGPVFRCDELDFMPDEY